MTNEENIKLVEDHIQLRLDPKIYAFSTNTIPNYLKVGDTLRSVDVRITEWEKLIYARLGQKPIITKEGDFSALLSQDHYFRDYSVHSFLEGIGKHRIDGELAHKYSIEFFENTDIHDVEQAINDIRQDYCSDELNKKYIYYNIADNTHTEIHGANDKEWHLRPNQQEVVNNFLSHPTEKKLLMYAVMRFGKSFTAIYCALAKKARKVLIVSAKADVKAEWQKTIETPTCFKNYKFICDKDLQNNFDIESYLSENADNGVAVFLTLQNLCGKDSDGNNIKRRLKQIYGLEFDLLIVDETHYGAWAHEYGKPIKDADEDVIQEEKKEYGQFINKVETIKAIQQLHLSGTPYNLLYENKFTEDNIVAMCQYKDILTAKEQWDADHFNDLENDKINPETGFVYQESDNPYFGFPQMLRFAFNLPSSIREELRRSKSSGAQWSLNDLFATHIQDGEVKFKHEAAVLTLLKAIDGSEENDDIFGFLNVPKIRNNDVCKHMVFALPFKYSCDAMELLLNKYKEQFLNLGKYEVLNITGHNLKSELDSVEKVKAKISECENSNPKIKTITLTVYKMLTGVTVKEWDTMIMLKNTQSPQEYDQAIFRIQNQFVQEYVAENGSRFKKDLKPQTILVDFDPVRMFNIQGLSTRVVNKVKGNVQSLEDTITDDLRFSPIIAYNAKNLVKVEPKNLIELILKYNREKSIIDDVKSVSWDSSLLSNSDLATYIRSQNPNGLNNTSTQTEAHEGERQSDFDNPDGDEDNDGHGNSGDSQSGNTGDTDNSNNDGEDKDIAKKYRMCIAKLAFFAFLSKSDIDSLQAVLNSLEPSSQYSEDNNRIFENLELDKKFIQGLIGFISRVDALDVDEVIKRANMLSKDEELSESERAANALNRFNRFSNSEIVTPNNIAADMCNLIGKDKLVEIVNSGEKILDIASKAGEFAFALYSILKGNVEDGILKNAIHSIPTSSTAYEFTRRIYEALGLNVECIAYGSRNADEAMTSYDLLEIKKEDKNKDTLDYERIIALLTQDKPFDSIKRNDTITQGGKQVKFGAIVGNPPYQEDDGGAQKSARPIYNYFVEIANKMQPTYLTLITPTRWFAGGKGLEVFRNKMLNDTHIKVLHDYLHPEDVFSNTNNRGGICFFLSDRTYDNSESFIDVFTHDKNSVVRYARRPLKTRDLEIFIRDSQSVSILDKVLPIDSVTETLEKYISAAKAFGFRTFFIKDSQFRPTENGLSQPIKCYGRANKIGYVEQSEITSHKDWIKKWKVYVPESNNIGTELNDDNQNSFVGAPNTICTETYLVVGAELDLNEISATNLSKYLRTQFARYMLSLAKISQHGTAKTYRFVPLQDFTEKSDIDWSKSVAEIDKRLYEKYKFSPDEIAFIESMIKPME